VWLVLSPPETTVDQEWEANESKRWLSEADGKEEKYKSMKQGREKEESKLERHEMGRHLRGM
jgi:hypothetical protein